MYRIVLTKTLHLEPVSYLLVHSPNSLPSAFCVRVTHACDLQVELKVSSLDQGHVFLLDAGKTIYVWQGVKSSLNARSKAR